MLGPIDMLPGAVAPFTGSYIATSGSNPTTNLVVVTNGITLVTNKVVSFTPTNIVTATGLDTCQVRAVSSAADCFGPVDVVPPFRLIRSTSLGNGALSLTFPTEAGKSLTVQFKNFLSDLTWTDLKTVTGTGGDISVADPAAALHPSRFYRVIAK